MKRLLSSLLLLTFSSQVLALPIHHPAGANLTYGDVSINQNIMSSMANPSSTAMSLEEDENQYRWGLFTLGLGFEFGQVDNLVDEFKQASTAMQTVMDDPASLITSTDGVTIEDLLLKDSNGLPILTKDGNLQLDKDKVAELEETLSAPLKAALDPVNKILNSLTNEGYASLFFGGHVAGPLVITHKFLRGSLTLDPFATSVKGKLSTIGAPIKASVLLPRELDPGTSTNVEPSIAVQSDAAMMVKVGGVVSQSVGYSMPVFKHDLGSVYAGARLNVYQAALKRVLMPILADQDAMQLLQDEVSALPERQTAVGIDLGALWLAKNYHGGVTLANINRPSFSYNRFSKQYINDLYNTNLNAGYTPTEIYKYVETDEKYQMDMQIRLEGAVHTDNKRWIAAAGLDLTKAEDIVGDNYQWLTLSAAYASQRAWLPGVRLGYRQNMTGTGMNYIGLGLSWFGIRLDAAMALNSVEFEGNKIPRSGMINLGWSMTF